MKETRSTHDNDSLRDMISNLRSRRLDSKTSLKDSDEFSESALSLSIDDRSSSLEHSSPDLGTSIPKSLRLNEELEEGDDVLGSEGRRESSDGVGDGDSNVEGIRSVQRFLLDHTELIELGREDLGSFGVELFESDDGLRDELRVHGDGFGEGSGSGDSDVGVVVL